MPPLRSTYAVRSNITLKFLNWVRNATKCVAHAYIDYNVNAIFCIQHSFMHTHTSIEIMYAVLPIFKLVSYLEIHNRFRYFNIDGFNNHNNIEWTQQTFRYTFHWHNKIIPFHIQFLIMIQTSFHHIYTIIWAWFFNVSIACAALLHFR